MAKGREDRSASATSNFHGQGQRRRQGDGIPATSAGFLSGRETPGDPQGRSRESRSEDARHRRSRKYLRRSPGTFVQGRSQPEGLRATAGPTDTHPENQRETSPFRNPRHERQGAAMLGEDGPGAEMGSGLRAAILWFQARQIRAGCSDGSQTRLRGRRWRKSPPVDTMPLGVGCRHKKLLRRN